MALPYTQNPVQISTNPNEAWLTDTGQIQGPYNYLGALWVPMFMQNSLACVVAKSMDAGLTWTLFQQTPPTITNRIQVFFDSTNGYVYFVGGASGKIRVTYFNLTTQVFAANVDSSFTAISSQIQAIQRTDGSLRIFYTPTAGTPRPLKWVSFTAGVFGSATTLDTGFDLESLDCTSAVYDSATGTTHLGYASTTTAGTAISSISINNIGLGYGAGDVVVIVQGGNYTATAQVTSVDGLGRVTGLTLTFGGNGYALGTGVATINYENLSPPSLWGSGLTVDINTISAANGYLLYNTLSTGDVAGTRQTIDPVTPTNGFRLFGNGLMYGAGVVFTQSWVTAAGQVNRFYVGTPANTAVPVWTKHNLHSIGSVPPTDQETCVVDATIVDGCLWFLYNRTNDVNPSTLLQTMRVRFDGATVFSPELVWDTLLYPPQGSGSPVFRETDGITASFSGTRLQLAITTTSDNSGNLTTVYFPIEFVAALSIICDSPPSGIVGIAYGPHTFPASGGVPPYTFSIIGSLPTGLFLDFSTGIVSGIPTVAGTFGFTVRVTDSVGSHADVVCSITIVSSGGGGGGPIALICNSPAGGFVGAAYSHQLGISGGLPPYTFSITVGALPTGLSVSNTGLISGTPTLSGTYSFTVHVVDSAGFPANVGCSITILNLPGNNCPDADNGGPG